MRASYGRITGHIAKIVAASLGLGLASAQATEGGGTSKIVGVETVQAGMMSDQGSLRMLVTVGGYRADRTLGGNGGPRPGLSNFDLSFDAVAARLQYVWKDVRLWGADIESRAGFTVYADADISFDVATPVGTLRRADSASGNGDGFIAPVTLGWHTDTFHQIAGVEIFFPAVRFDRNRLANLSRGYTSVAPAYRFTWLPGPMLEVSGNLVYLYNLKNSETQYKSGRELSFDFGLGYSLGEGWQAGLSGYIYKQVTDDTVNGVRFGDGNRGQTTAIGPFIRYSPGKQWGVTLKWQIEGHTKNRAEGNRFFLQIARAIF